MTIAQASRLFRTTKLTSEQLCNHSYNLAKFGEESLLLNAYTKILPINEILHQAQQSDNRIRDGIPKSLLDGIPVTIKANIAVGKYWEMPNACSVILASPNAEEGGSDSIVEECFSTSNNTNSNNSNNIYESDIARRLLRDCGAVLIGITNMDEFGMGSLGINNGLQQGNDSHQQTQNYTPTYNPIPLIQRIHTLQNRQHMINKEEYEQYWLHQIQNSTPDNPHGIKDEDSLIGLLSDVQYLVYGDDSICEKEQKNVYNRHDEYPLLSPGGSSSGAAAATSHGSSLLSLGTDTGGSIRLPSAWTSTVGFKPSYGTWSRYGVVSYASSLDTVGFITGSTKCAKIAWQCLRNENNNSTNKHDTEDPSKIWNGQMCRDATARVYHKDNNIENSSDEKHSTDMKPLANVRVGIPSAFSLQELPPSIATAWSQSAYNLQNIGGATLVSITESKLSSDLIKLALASYYVLACAEASSNLSRYDGVRYGLDVKLDSQDVNNDILQSVKDDIDFSSLHDMNILEQQISATRAYGFGEEVQRRVLAGTSVLSSDRFHTHYEAAAVVRAKLSQSLDSLFRTSLNDDDVVDNDKVDVMLVPTALSFPCRLNDSNGKGEGMDPTAAFANDVMTIPISLGGLPSISVPAASAENDIIGMQIFSSKGSEDLLLRVADNLKVIDDS